MTKPVKASLIVVAFVVGALLITLLSSALSYDEKLVEAAQRVRTDEQLAAFERNFPSRTMAIHHSGYTRRHWYGLAGPIAARRIEFHQQNGEGPWSVWSEIEWF